MTWRRVDPYFARRIQLAIFVLGFGFGLDQILTPVGSSTALTAAEQSAFPLWAWGTTIVLASLAGFTVEWLVLGNDHPLVPTHNRWRYGWVSNVAHIVLLAMFVALAGSALSDVVTRGIETGYWFGFRTAIFWGGYAYANWQFIRRLGDPL